MGEKKIMGINPNKSINVTKENKAVLPILILDRRLKSSY